MLTLTSKNSTGFWIFALIPPTKPGLGVELNETIAKKYSYTGTKLHLEMAEI
jgi:hypothetical protein